MLAKLQNCGTSVYTRMVKPLPGVIQRAVFTFWLSTLITGILEWLFHAVQDGIRKRA